MKLHDKAKLYDELLKDYTELIKEMEKFKKELEELPNREDLKEAKESNPSSYYPMATGSYGAMAFGLDIKLHKFRGVLEWYNSQK